MLTHRTFFTLRPRHRFVKIHAFVYVLLRRVTVSVCSLLTQRKRCSPAYPPTPNRPFVAGWEGILTVCSTGNPFLKPREDGVEVERDTKHLSSDALINSSSSRLYCVGHKSRANTATSFTLLVGGGTFANNR